MALTKLQAESLNLADDFTFTGTVAGAGGNNRPAFHAYLSSDFTIPNSTNTKVQFNVETFDTDNCYDNSTNYRFTPNVAGKYYVYFHTLVESGNTFDIYAKINKNGSGIAEVPAYNNGSAEGVNCFTTIDMNGTTDYLEAYVWQNFGASKNIAGSSPWKSRFGAYKIIT